MPLRKLLTKSQQKILAKVIQYLNPVTTVLRHEDVLLGQAQVDMQRVRALTVDELEMINVHVRHPQGCLPKTFVPDHQLHLSIYNKKNSLLVLGAMNHDNHRPDVEREGSVNPRLFFPRKIRNSRQRTDLRGCDQSLSQLLGSVCLRLCLQVVPPQASMVQSVEDNHHILRACTQPQTLQAPPYCHRQLQVRARLSFQPRQLLKHQVYYQSSQRHQTCRQSDTAAFQEDPRTVSAWAT